MNYLHTTVVVLALSAGICGGLETLVSHDLLDLRSDPDVESTSLMQLRANKTSIASVGEPHTSISYLLRAIVPEQLNYISVNVTYTTVWEELVTFPERRPRLFNLWLATVKTWAADLLVQLGTFEPDGRKLIDWRRSASFALFGFLYVGFVQWIIYVSVFAWMFPGSLTFANEPFNLKIHDGGGQLALVKQVMTDNFFVNPFIYFPVFYCIKSMMQRVSSSTNGKGMMSHLESYKVNFWKDNLCSTAVWIPVDVICYSAPMYMRMPLDHSFSFLWTMILSYFRGAAPPSPTDKSMPGGCATKGISMPGSSSYNACSSSEVPCPHSQKC